MSERDSDIFLPPEFEQKNNRSKSFILFVRGLPGSGKSDLTNMLRLDRQWSDVVYLNPDEIDPNSNEYMNFVKTQVGSPGTQDNYKYRILLHKAIDGIRRGKNIVWDQPWSSLWGLNDTLFNINYFLEKERLGDKVTFTPLVIDVEVPFDVARNRVHRRISLGGHGPSDKTLSNFFERFEDSSGLSAEFKTFKIDGTLERETNFTFMLSFIKGFISTNE